MGGILCCQLGAAVACDLKIDIREGVLVGKVFVRPKGFGRPNIVGGGESVFAN